MRPFISPRKWYLVSKVWKLKEFSKPYRPCLVVSNDTQNQFDKNVVVVGLSTDEMEIVRTFEVFIENTLKNGLDYPSKILCDSPFTWDKEIRFEKKLGVVNQEIMKKVKKAWQIAFEAEE